MAINVPNDGNGWEEFQSTDPRIIKLPPKWSEIKGLTPPLSEETRQLIAKESVLQDAFVNSQYLSILSDAQDRLLPAAPEGIGIRAIMVSTYSPVHLIANEKKTYDVPDIDTVLKNGTELQSGDILVASQTERDEHLEHTSNHRVLQYLVSGVKQILNTKDPDVKKKLTPAILIYDLSQLVQIDGYRHKFKNPERADKAIIGLYPVNIEPAK